MGRCPVGASFIAPTAADLIYSCICHLCYKETSRTTRYCYIYSAFSQSALVYSRTALMPTTMCADGCANMIFYSWIGFGPWVCPCGPEHRATCIQPLQHLVCVQFSLEHRSEAHITIKYQTCGKYWPGLINQHIAHAQALMLAAGLKVWHLSSSHRVCIICSRNAYIINIS